MKIKYPKVGEKFYWKDQEGNIYEDTKIFEEEVNYDLGRCK